MMQRDHGRSGQPAFNGFKFWKRMLPDWLKQRAMVGWYNYIGRMNTDGEVLFLNHGFADPETEGPQLPDALETQRYPIQLYHHICRQADLSSKDVLEVSSGLGGGVGWIAACLNPRSVTGLDIAADAVKACRARNKDARVRFETGDAQAMPFADGSFDALVNVESSLNYPDFAAFLKEAVRLLRPGGYFMFADYRSAKGYVRMKEALEQLKWRIVLAEDISPSIVRGLVHTRAKNRTYIQRHIPRFLQSTALQFARLNTDADDEAVAFASGKKRYLAMVLQKPA
ncbi:MAG: methyltransferase domain-containing protein [Aestuariivirga sp.]|nr:methyltransferase domain-containing protein [Aestuariivirga sp.]